MFAGWLDASLRHRVLVLAVALVLVVAGVWQTRQARIDVLPDLNKPTVTAMTEAGGRAPEEVEQLLSVPIEAAVAGLPGVETVRSVSAPGLSIVTVTFGWSADPWRARQLVAERLAAVAATLPAGLEPRMGPITSIMGEILLIALPIETGRDHALATRDFADWVLRPRLMAVRGVAQVIPIGGEVRQFQVRPDPQRMADLGVGVEALRAALTGFATNASGGFLDHQGREALIRPLGQTRSLEDLRAVPVASHRTEATFVRLEQVAEVGIGAAPRRGDAGFQGAPAVVLSVQKQPGADTLVVTRAVEAALAEAARARPEGVGMPQVTFRQADFIEASIQTLRGKLAIAAVVVALVVALFLGRARTTVISLTALPLSILTALLVLEAWGLLIDTLVLGGLAIAIGELVDDAIVDLENILRRLRLNAASAAPQSALAVIRAASQEVRGAVVWSTAIVVLVFVPLLALPGMEGRLFAPLGLAYITAILASLIVAVTVTPVLAWFLLGRAPTLWASPEPRWVLGLKARYQRRLEATLDAPAWPILASVGVLLLAAALWSTFPRAFLPAFNEGSAMVSLRLDPGVTLADSVQMGRAAERLLATVPEVRHVARRTGRAELDEHAEGVHVSELDVSLRPSSRPMALIHQDLRTVVSALPGSVSIGQPISHRLDHLLSGVRAQIAIRLIGDDLEVLRAQAAALQQRLQGVTGLVDLEVEKIQPAPQIRIEVDAAAASRLGVPASRVVSEAQALLEGTRIGQVIEGARRVDLVLRLAEPARAREALEGMRIATPSGPVPLAVLARVVEADGPNQVVREDGRRRIVLSANVQGRTLSEAVTDLQAALADFPLAQGVAVSLGGQYTAQAQAARTIGLLAGVAALGIVVLLYTRLRSLVLVGLVLVNVPIALAGGLIGLALAGLPLSVASLVGLVTLAGIATRNGLLKLSHWLHLIDEEGAVFGRETTVQGAVERLVPVLMTALTAALALAPLLFEAEQPGTELLHPVAVVIFAGLLLTTGLDAFLTPVLFERGAAGAVRRVREEAFPASPAARSLLSVPSSHYPSHKE